MPILTVVTITFNDFDGFESTSKSFESIGDRWEWLVIDGSDDPQIQQKVAQVVSSKGGKLLQESDEGRFDAMNKALMMAKGKIILYMNGGDQFFHPDIPEQIIESYLIKGWDWAVGQAVIVDADNNLLWTWPSPKVGSLKLKLGVRSYCHQATVVKTEKLKRLGGFNADSLYSDWAVSLVLEKEQVPYSPQDTWVKFLTGGVSGNQTLEYWFAESIRIREYYNYRILFFKSADRLMQFIAKIYLQSYRGQLMRPDLKKKYG